MSSVEAQSCCCHVVVAKNLRIHFNAFHASCCVVRWPGQSRLHDLSKSGSTIQWGRDSQQEKTGHAWRFLENAPRSQYCQKGNFCLLSQNISSPGVLACYVLPLQFPTFLEAHHNEQKLWVQKPFTSNKGKGVRLVTTLEVKSTSSGVIQEFVAPKLLDGKKFDIRLYLVVFWKKHLKAYLHRNGWVRSALTAARRHDPLSMIVNKASSTPNVVSQDFYAAFKTISQVFSEVEQDIILRRLKDTLRPLLKMAKQNVCEECFTLFEIDVGLDPHLQPFIYEFNTKPAMGFPKENVQNNAILELFEEVYGDLLCLTNLSSCSEPSKCWRHAKRGYAELEL